MSRFDQFFSGSLLSRERLLQAREFYEPAPEPGSPQEGFKRWTQRVSLQSELGAARELAGLSDAELADLEAEFVRQPTRQRTDRLRYAVPLGACLTVIGAIGFGWQAFAATGQGYSGLAQGFNVACVAAGLLALAVGFMMALSTMHLDIAHGITGLYAGKLDEQHPWLYKVASLTANPAAEEYRQRVLRERGPLRGVDYPMMRELARAHDILEQARPARSIASQIQDLAPSGPRNSPPRLVRLNRTAVDSQVEAVDPMQRAHAEF